MNNTIEYIFGDDVDNSNLYGDLVLYFIAIFYSMVLINSLIR
jgi:hypothetical protein